MISHITRVIYVCISLQSLISQLSLADTSECTPGKKKKNQQQDVRRCQPLTVEHNSQQ